MQIKPYIMGKVDKLIFNELASHRAVTFPGIGTLWVEHVPADMSGDKVRPPQNKVRYTSKPHEGARTVAEIIGLQGAGPADAEKEYNEWLNNAVTPRGVDVDGAGELESKIVYPSEDSVRVLKPVTETQTADA